MYGALQHSLGAPLHRSFLPLNLHSARVRRNRARLPSSRCIESARTHRARAPALPSRASDTTLARTFPGTRPIPWATLKFAPVAAAARCDIPH